MPEIRIAYDLPSFKNSFVWEATEAEFARMLAQSQPANALASVVYHAPKFLDDPDPVKARGVRVMLTTWALQLDTTSAERPGRVCDYIGVYDFAVTITRVTETGAEASVGATARLPAT